MADHVVARNLRSWGRSVGRISSVESSSSRPNLGSKTSTPKQRFGTCGILHIHVRRYVHRGFSAASVRLIVSSAMFSTRSGPYAVSMRCFGLPSRSCWWNGSICRTTWYGPWCCPYLVVFLRRWLVLVRAGWTFGRLRLVVRGGWTLSRLLLRLVWSDFLSIGPP